MAMFDFVNSLSEQPAAIVAEMNQLIDAGDNLNLLIRPANAISDQAIISGGDGAGKGALNQVQVGTEFVSVGNEDGGV